VVLSNARLCFGRLERCLLANYCAKLFDWCSLPRYYRGGYSLELDKGCVYKI